MRQLSFHILPGSQQNGEQHTRLSFRRFVQFIEARRHAEQTMKAKLYEFVLRAFEANPSLSGPVDVEALENYPHLHDLLYAALFPPLGEEQELVWALSLPCSDHIFYSTSAFYRQLYPGNAHGMLATATPEEKAAFTSSLEQVKYALILERFYQIKPAVQEEIVYVWTDKTTNLPRYFSIHIDNRFVEVSRVGEVPAIEAGEMRHQLKKADDLCQLEQAIPLSDYLFEGFSIVTATEITVRYALHKMRSAIIRHVPENFDDTYRTILSLLQAMFGKQRVEFGLLPFLKVNDRLVAYYANYSHSISINMAREQRIPEEAFVNKLNQYFQHPKVVILDSQREPLPDDLFKQAFERRGIKAYALLPVYHNNELAGLLEVSTVNENVLDYKLLAGLEPAMPILAQLMHNNQAEFMTSIDNVIKVNFTAIQPSVQWKFNEVAWWYLKNRFEQGIPGTPGPIRFEQVYPLYGSIDIRNSTVERNNALDKDLHTYLTILDSTLEEVKELPGGGAALSLQAAARTMQQQFSGHISGREEAGMLPLIEQADALLRPFANHDGAGAVVSNYFAAVDPQLGIVFEQRRLLEQSMQLVNSSITQYLESMHAEFQRLYPIYFEKFRTDGIEYDLYVGQSINPSIPYRPEYLRDLQVWQLSSMVAIARMEHTNLPYMPVKLQTTQLIYVNSGTIDISFRPDEKRFDAEGGYSIRYHIVKKRIDKVHVKSSGERLTQPGQIAIVYVQETHREDYLEYIAQLQQEGMLAPEVEELELEDLQGISGLKALRVTVLW
ncbi:MAG: hypothetical protein INR73_13105 [Williamsia sp.]|nr:hypothetical protein [Williamsia sp.]